MCFVKLLANLLFCTSGTVSLGMTGLCLLTMADSPESVGLVAPHEGEKKEERGEKHSVSSSF